MERRCYQFACDHYPDCKNSGGSCCCIEVDEEMEIRPEECYLLPEKPLYAPGREDGRGARARSG